MATSSGTKQVVRAGQKLTKFREILAAIGVDAFVCGSADAHQSEYVTDRDKRRAFLTEFTGSAGTAVVTASKAALWTDGRYWVQARAQMAADWELMKAGDPETPSIEDWLVKELKKGEKVGIDPYLVTLASARKWKEKLSKTGVNVVPTVTNPVDTLWGNDQPAAPANPLQVHPLSLAGKDTTAKLVEIRKKMQDKGAETLVLSSLDEIAWLFNLRGSDIDYNPVFMAYAVVTMNQSIIFVDDSKLSGEVRDHLPTEVRIMPYDAILDHLKNLPKESKCMVDPHTTSLALSNALEGVGVILLEEQSPIAMLKSVKNEAELEGLRQAHLRDGAAVVRFLAWLEDAVEQGQQGQGLGMGWPLTECSIADKLEEFRKQEEGFVSLSFETIAGYGPNGAIIHYKAVPESCAVIGTDAPLLLDSGAQYVDGTTDVTRTIHLGKPNPWHKECYTRVLKGHIGIATAVFPKGVKGKYIDALARLALWDSGLDYKHGTGHGVGAFLNVHEGPQGIALRDATTYEAGFEPGMTTSNEPGYYQTGSFGIRIETVCICKEVTRVPRYPELAPPATELGKFCSFETITAVPIALNLVDCGLLTDKELSWLNNYNQWCRSVLTPLLKDDSRTLAYLDRETRPLLREGPGF